MKPSNLLINEPPLQVVPSLAVLVGLNAAIVLQQLHYWLNNKSTGIEIDGHKWVYNTYKEWHENFPFWSEKTIQRTFQRLEEEGIIISRQYNRKNWDGTKYYRIDYDKFDALTCTESLPQDGQFDNAEEDNLTSSILTETTTENTTESSAEHKTDNIRKTSTPISDPDEIGRVIEKITGLPYNSYQTIKACEEIKLINPTQDDIMAAYTWLSQQGKSVKYYGQLVGPIRTENAKRLQNTNSFHEYEKFPKGYTPA